jgi:phosphoglycolate phosphatase
VSKDKKIKLFWDIDNTLLSTNGSAATAFANAVAEFAGNNVSIEKKTLSGFTDYEIALHLLGKLNIEVSLTQITRILENYSRLLPESLSSGKVNKIGSIDSVLKKFDKLGNYEMAIGTGNFLSGAMIKLKHVSLLDYFKSDNFFCASESFWNRDLVIQNAKNSLLENQVGVVIGDSPKDVTSARNASLKIIAVATGMHTVNELLEWKPDLVLGSDWDFEELYNGLKLVT